MLLIQTLQRLDMHHDATIIFLHFAANSYLCLIVCKRPAGIPLRFGGSLRTTVIPDGVCLTGAGSVLSNVPGVNAVLLGLRFRLLLLARASGDTASLPSTTNKSSPANLFAAYSFRLLSGSPPPAIAMGM